MKNYKEYNREVIGASDIATLIMAGYKNDKGLCLEKLNFGEDNEYKAYIVDKDAEIGSHYSLVAEFNSWMKIYDDDSLSYKCKADTIKVYRACEMGCIIQLINQ